jgi:hypothetical protein
MANRLVPQFYTAMFCYLHKNRNYYIKTGVIKIKVLKIAFIAKIHGTVFLEWLAVMQPVKP